MNPIDEIKARIDIIDLVSESVQLRRAGKNWTGFCPFHPNSRTPAFVVFPDSGSWRCFGQCNEGGDIFGFVMKKEGWDFPTTLKALANRAGVTLEPPSPQAQAASQENERLQSLLEEAVTFYRHQLWNTPAGKTALEYLRKRGLTDVTLENFGLGYAPHTWEALMQHFTGRGVDRADLVEAGLASQREDGTPFDRFRNRIMIPIRDGQGQMAGFGARILNPDDVPKFLNSPQTPLFDKGRLLYGLDQARKAIRAQDQVVIVEGYLDVIALHQQGYQNAVSPMGTALTEDQLRLLKRFTHRIVLALDPDAAGEKATLRGLEIARQALDHETELAFDARGLLRHEARLQADVRVTTLPEGMDPDDVVLRDPEEWRRILEAAKPVVTHVMDTLIAGQNVDDPKVKSAVAAQVLPLIADVANPVERDAYRQRLARALKVDERSLMAAQPIPARPRRPRTQPAAPPAQSSLANVPGGPAFANPAYPLEQYVLSVMLRMPELIHTVDRTLQEASLGRLDVSDFNQTDHQLLLRIVQESVEQAELEPVAHIQEHLDENLRPAAQALIAADLPEITPEALLQDLVRAVMRIRLARLNQSMGQLRFLLEDVTDGEQMPTDAYDEMMMQHIKIRRLLDLAYHGQGSK